MNGAFQQDGESRMSSGWLGRDRFRFDGPHPASQPGPVHLPGTSDEDLLLRSSRLAAAIERTRDHLLARQAPEGYWVGELEGDTILESEYILLLAYLGQH